MASRFCNSSTPWNREATSTVMEKQLSTTHHEARGRTCFPEKESIRVLFSFPHKLGGPRIANTAWQQVNGITGAGARVIACPGVLQRVLPSSVLVWPTLAKWRLRIPYKLLGRTRACALHDWIVARRLERLAGQVDVVHTWPLGALRTLKVARKLRIPSVLERPNAHTRYAYSVVEKECQKLGIKMPKGHEHSYNGDYLKLEEEEYEAADYLLCPSDFVARTFLDEGFSPEKLRRHQYGFDEKVYFAGNQDSSHGGGLRILFAGGCAPRKGLHYALEAWLKSSAHRNGRFQIAGEFIDSYREKLGAMLAHPSVEVLGHRRDLAILMRQADLFVLPSIEEGSALVTSEARGCGCVLLVSEAAGAICRTMENALTHRVGVTQELADQISLLDRDRNLLNRLRAASLSTVMEATWTEAGRRLLSTYEEIIHKRCRNL